MGASLHTEMNSTYPLFESLPAVSTMPRSFTPPTCRDEKQPVTRNITEPAVAARTRTFFIFSLLDSHGLSPLAKPSRSGAPRVSGCIPRHGCPPIGRKSTMGGFGSALRKEKLQGPVIGGRSKGGRHQPRVVIPMSGAVAQDDQSDIGAVANVWPPPGGVGAAARGRDNVAIDIIGESREIEVTHVSIRRQDVARPLFIRVVSQTVAHVRQGKAAEISRRRAQGVVWANQNSG